MRLAAHPWLGARSLARDRVTFDDLCDFMLALKAGLPARMALAERDLWELAQADRSVLTA